LTKETDDRHIAKSMKDIVGHLRSLLGLPGRSHGGSLSFREVFDRFREVLDNNNRALEIIADMGEKLGGGYLFDVNYIKDTYSGLSAVQARGFSFMRIFPGTCPARSVVRTRHSPN
jgi:hypothetical protein